MRRTRRKAPASQFVATIKANPNGTNAAPHLLWIGCSTEDSLFPASKRFSYHLDELHIKHTFYTMPGMHSWDCAAALPFAIRAAAVSLTYEGKTR